jgi:hypothetical protein
LIFSKKKKIQLCIIYRSYKMQTLDKVRKFFQNDVYATGTTGIEIADARPGYAKS